MSSLFKYLPDQFVDPFIREGKILFRALSYFRDYEDAQIRGDEFEGTKLFRPEPGLEITKTETGEKLVLPYSLESTTNEKDIFVFCTSSVLSNDLASEFSASTCIEIFDISRFLSEIRNALARRPSIKNKTLLHGLVNYYSATDPPLADWALPERITMSKLNAYSKQQEHRIAFGINGALRVQNTSQRLVPLGNRHQSRLSEHPECMLKIGNIGKICKIHHLA